MTTVIQPRYGENSLYEASRALPYKRRWTPSQMFEALQRGATLNKRGDRDALLAHPDAIASEKVVWFIESSPALEHGVTHFDHVHSGCDDEHYADLDG